MQKRTTDNKFNKLIIIERHHKDDIKSATFKTYFAKIDISGKRNGKLVKVGTDKEGISIAVMRDRARDVIQDFHDKGLTTLTVKKFFDEIYIPNCINRNVKTLDDIKGNFKNNINEHFGDNYLTDITPAQILSWFLEISKKSKGTANHSLTIFKAIYNLALNLDEVKKNPTISIKKNYIPHRNRYLTDKEKIVFLQELKKIGKDSPYGSAFIYLAYLTGARKGELAKATWNDLRGDYIELKEHKTSNKTNKPRIIRLDQEALSLITRLPRNNDNDTILKIKDPVRQWKKLMKRTGIKDFRFHDLRHNFGTQSMNMGIDMIRVADLMGHTSVKAMQIYQTVKPETAKMDIKEIGNYLTN